MKYDMYHWEYKRALDAQFQIALKKVQDIFFSCSSLWSRIGKLVSVKVQISTSVDQTNLWQLLNSVAWKQSQTIFKSMGMEIFH